MKKRNIIAILASLAVVLTVFTACDKSGDDTNPTIVGADGQVYEQVTEVVTNAAGEAVTDAEGNTKVDTVTKPVTTTGNGSTESTTTYEDVTFPEGEKVEVEVDKEGRPEDCKLDKLLTASAQNKALYLNCTVVTSDNFGLGETGINMKMYMKNDKFALEFPLLITTIRVAYDGKEMNFMIPSQKSYYPIASGEDSVGVIDSVAMWESIVSDSLEYKETTNVTIRGNSYVCEVYGDSTNVNKYYFNSKDELKRIEVIAADGTTSILKVNECSTNIDDSIFTVPNGYTQLTEEDMMGFSASLGY